MPDTAGRLSFGRACARGAAGFCVAFAAFQVALALGAPYGDIAWGGSSPVLPPTLRYASAGAAAYLLLAAAALEVRAGDWGRRLPPLPFRLFTGFLALQLALNTAGNLAATTGAERYGMGAASALGCLLCVGALLARANGPRTGS
ncbi:hypothetical protein [Phenylobacterium sp.]|uniref:hypothetical protein n=1 Tax=Phenylobacterium sp. TaxID=1871053 RepID=UPI0025D070F8|nr:hypothetical protein [Phenylobacterium sp.]